MSVFFFFFGAAICFFTYAEINIVCVAIMKICQSNILHKYIYIYYYSLEVFSVFKKRIVFKLYK